MKSNIVMHTICVSLILSIGLVFNFQSTALAEIINLEGQHLCPNHNPHHTSWSNDNGCTCDPGWIGSSCNIAESTGPGGHGGGAGAGVPEGYGDGGGGGSVSPNPYKGDGNTMKQFSSMRAAKKILIKKCWEADGKPAWYSDRDTGKRIAYCGFGRSRQARDCFHEGANIWICGNSTPTRSRVGNRIAEESPLMVPPKTRKRPSSVRSSAPKSRKRGATVPRTRTPMAPRPR